MGDEPKKLKSYELSSGYRKTFPGKIFTSRPICNQFLQVNGLMYGLKNRPRLKDTYESFFKTILAETGEQRQSAYRLRYEVYCVEHRYEDEEQNANGIESDAHDTSALHALLIHRASRSVVGTARLILPRSDQGRFTPLP